MKYDLPLTQLNGTSGTEHTGCRALETPFFCATGTDDTTIKAYDEPNFEIWNWDCQFFWIVYSILGVTLTSVGMFFAGNILRYI